LRSKTTKAQLKNCPVLKARCLSDLLHDYFLKPIKPKRVLENAFALPPKTFAKDKPSFSKTQTAYFLLVR